MKEHMSPEYLEAKLCDGLRRGAIDTLQVVEAANGGDHFADRALRRLYFDMEDRGEATPATLKAYGLMAALRGPVKRKAGGYTKYDKLGRDIGIAVLVYLTHRRFHLLPIEEEKLPIANNMMGLGAIAVGGGDDFYMLYNAPEYPLPFKVLGYFDLRECSLTDKQQGLETKRWEIRRLIQEVEDERLDAALAALTNAADQIPTF